MKHVGVGVRENANGTGGFKVLHRESQTCASSRGLLRVCVQDDVLFVVEPVYPLSVRLNGRSIASFSSDMPCMCAVSIADRPPQNGVHFQSVWRSVLARAPQRHATRACFCNPCPMPNCISATMTLQPSLHPESPGQAVSRGPH